MQIFRFWILLIFLFCFGQSTLTAQEYTTTPFFQAADSLHKGRFWTAAITGTALYSSAMIGLNELWYSEYDRSAFHFFNDAGEWKDMDKMGHLYTAYFESFILFKGARWTGIDRRKAMWIGAGIGSLLQASIETLDGFSEKWGFSVPDMAFNTLGVSLFVGQELLWQDQRILMKVSSTPTSYPSHLVYSNDGDHPDVLSRRADDLFGSNYAAAFLKDYNAMTVWGSVNLKAFVPKSRLPEWLNLAVGYGAQNLYGGFENRWEWQGQSYQLDPATYPRYRQFYLSPDIDLSRIKTRSPFVKMLFTVFNLFKIPAPALEVNTQGKLKFHPFHF